jgi:hypothetical protein
MVARGASKKRSSDAEPATAGKGEEMMSKKQKMEIAAESLNQLDMAAIKSIMDSQGETLPSVLLSVDGKATEVSFDTTPKLKKVNEVVGCAPHENITFAGQWEDVVSKGDCVLLIIRDDDSAPINKAKLQPPFHEAEIPGAILLQRSGKQGEVLPFTLKDYKKFQSKKIKEWQPAEEEEEEEDEEDEEDDDDDDEEDDDDDEDEEGAMAALDDVEIDPEEAKKKLMDFLEDYKQKNDGNLPSPEELLTIQQTIFMMMKMEAADEDFEDEEDEEEEEE